MNKPYQSTESLMMGGNVNQNGWWFQEARDFLKKGAIFVKIGIKLKKFNPVELLTNL